MPFKQTMWHVYARTPRTTWVELNAFDNEADARALVKDVLDGGGHEVMMETSEEGRPDAPK